MNDFVLGIAIVGDATDENQGRRVDFLYLMRLLSLRLTEDAQSATALYFLTSVADSGVNLR